MEKASVYENAQTIVGLLESISEGRKAIVDGTKDIDSHDHRLNDKLLPALKTIEDKVRLANEALGLAEKDVTKQEEDIAAMKLSDLRSECEAAKELLRNIKTAKERIETLAESKKQREELRNNLVEQLASIDAKKSKLAAMDAPIHDAELKMNVCKENLDKQKDTIDKFASSLRQKLHVGDICPVCRQQIYSELPHEEALAALVATLQESYDEAEKSYRRLQEGKNKIEAEIKTETKAYERGVKAFDKDQTVANAEAKAAEACRSCGLEKLDDAARSNLDALEASTTIRKDNLDGKIKDGEQKENSLKKLRKDLDAKRKSLQSLTEDMKKAEKAVSDCKAKIDTAKTLISTRKAETESAAKRVGELVVGEWDIDWNENPEAFGDALNMAAQTYKANGQKLQSLRTRLDNAKTYINNVTDVTQSITRVMPAWKMTEAAVASKVDNLLDKANRTSNSLTAVLTTLNSAKESYNANKTKLDAFLASNKCLSAERLSELDAYKSSDIIDVNKEIVGFRNDVVAKRTLLDNATKQQTDHQQKKPELQEDDTLENIVERIDGYEKALGEIGEETGSIKQELKTDAENKHKLGTPAAPHVDFSLDIPSISSDARQMVYSLINSEEEMNQQVLYLLAVGRFMAQGRNNAGVDNPNQQSQASLAMQSILSGTIMQQVNEVLGSLTSHSNWNFGANISTGTEGFNNAEYEGLLSGRLLSGRLLVDGQFGYRDNANATTSFIGDFDLKYLLYPNGNLAINFYNKTNDRYFTRNSLNTQGIGLLMKKDFSSLSDLFGLKRKKGKKKTLKTQSAEGYVQKKRQGKNSETK